MINRIIDFSVQHKFLVLVCAALACIGGWWSMQALPLDAMPDLSETQVIIYSRWDRSPDIIEDQVTYPIVTAMTGAPCSRAWRMPTRVSAVSPDWVTAMQRVWGPTMGLQ